MMSYTLQGGGRGVKSPGAQQNQEFDDAKALLKRDAVSYLQPFFNEAEGRHPGQTRNIAKRVKELKEKTVEVMRERLKAADGQRDRGKPREEGVGGSDQGVLPVRQRQGRRGA